MRLATVEVDGAARVAAIREVGGGARLEAGILEHPASMLELCADAGPDRLEALVAAAEWRPLESVRPARAGPEPVQGRRDRPQLRRPRRRGRPADAQGAADLREVPVDDRRARRRRDLGPRPDRTRSTTRRSSASSSAARRATCPRRTPSTTSSATRASTTCRRATSSSATASGCAASPSTRSARSAPGSSPPTRSRTRRRSASRRSSTATRSSRRRRRTCSSACARSSPTARGRSPCSPGDLIATGTPAGVGIYKKPPRLLEDGDEMIIRIERIGDLRNVCRVWGDPKVDEA